MAEFDMSEWFRVIMDTIYRIVSYPVYLYINYIPSWLKRAVIVALFLISIVIIAMVIRYRNSWRTRYF
jgi:hypothetical protein